MDRPVPERIAAACLDLLYPPHCVACDARLGPGQGPVTEAFCLECALGLEPVPAGACARCADPAVAGSAVAGSAVAGGAVAGGALGSGAVAGSAAAPGRLCARCRRAPPGFGAVLAVGLHGGPLLEAIHALKYDRKPHLVGPLARLMVARVLREVGAGALGAAGGAAGASGVGHPEGGPGAPPVVVVPVPLHPARLRERGFDQAEHLAAALARGIHRPIFPSALWRRRPTVPQASLGRAARAVNLEGAFAATRQARRVRGTQVLLVDDVLTTGATAAAAAAPLVAAGAAGVTVVVLARAD